MVDRKLSICILGPAYPYKGGISAFNERLAHSLINEGHKVDIITFTLQYPSFLFPGKSQYSSSPAPKGLSISRKLNTINPYTWIKTGRWMRKQNYDLIITRFWLPVIGLSLATTIRIAKKDSSTKAIAIIDNIIPHEKRPGDSLFTKIFVKNIDCAITLSKGVRKEAQELFPSLTFHLSPHPIYDIYGALITKEEAANHLGLDPSKKYILYFGYIRDYKGLDLLLIAFKKALASNDALFLLVAGEYYTDSKKYTDLIKQLNIEDRVIMHTDFISDEEVKYYFGVSDLISQTYKSASQSGISQIAIHFEKPMICTNVGGLPEIVEVGVNGILVQPDPDDVARGLNDFFSSVEKYYNNEAAKSLKKQYSWTTFTKEMLKIYSNLNIGN